MVSTSTFVHRSSAERSVDGLGCRFCGSPLRDVVVDLGLSPLCQSQVEPHQLNHYERFYPLTLFACRDCWLLQVQAHVTGQEIFSHYAYFSSYSDSWLAHAAAYTEMIVDRLQLGGTSQVIEIASNDGYLLRNFVHRSIPCLGIEPAANVARAAASQGIPVLERFFGLDTARELAAAETRADLLIANNVMAHVPDLNDFLAGIKTVLAPQGTFTAEFGHALKLVQLNQFDSIYQEHYCYFLLLALQKIFAHHGLKIFDVECLPTHGGSLRIYAAHDEDRRPISSAVFDVVQQELADGMTDLQTYHQFACRVRQTKWRLLEFLIDARRRGKTVVAYGAPGKGNTLLNYCGIREDLVEYTVDRNPFKQHHFLVGSRIPVYPPDVIGQTQPDFVLVLPWNLRGELEPQLSYIRRWGGQLVFAIPELEIV